MWAGQRFTREKTRVVLGLTTDEFSFEMACGYPQGERRRMTPVDSPWIRRSNWNRSGADGSDGRPRAAVRAAGTA